MYSRTFANDSSLGRIAGTSSQIRARWRVASSYCIDGQLSRGVSSLGLERSSRDTLLARDPFSLNISAQSGQSARLASSNDPRRTRILGTTPGSFSRLEGQVSSLSRVICCCRLRSDPPSHGGAKEIASQGHPSSCI